MYEHRKSKRTIPKKRESEKDKIKTWHNTTKLNSMPD